MRMKTFQNLTFLEEIIKKKLWVNKVEEWIYDIYDCFKVKISQLLTHKYTIIFSQASYIKAM